MQGEEKEAPGQLEAGIVRHQCAALVLKLEAAFVQP
jgi:hypothetical protein